MPQSRPNEDRARGRKRWHGRCSLLKFAPNRLKWTDDFHLLDLPGPMLSKLVLRLSVTVLFNCLTLIDLHPSPLLINLPSPTATTFFKPPVCRPLPSSIPSRIKSTIPSGLVVPQLANLNLYVAHHPIVPTPSPILLPNTSHIPSLPLPGDTTQAHQPTLGFFKVAHRR